MLTIDEMDNYLKVNNDSHLENLFKLVQIPTVTAKGGSNSLEAIKILESIFKPLGFKSSRLVSDFLTDRKIGVPEKKDVFILLNRSEIVAVIGYQISDDYRVTEETGTVYRLTLRKEAI